MTENAPKRPPKPYKLTGSGLKLWNRVVKEYALETHELSVLEELCRTKTRIEQLDEIVDADGLMVDSPQGRRVHPAAVESRQLRIVFTGLSKTLRFPVGDDV